MHRGDQLARAKLSIQFNGLCQTFASKFFTRRVLRLGNAIGVEHQHVAGLGCQVILMITSVSEHSERYAAAIDETNVAIWFEQNRWIVACVCVSESSVGDIENSVESRYKLITLDRFPKQIIYLRHRDMRRVTDVCSRSQAGAQKRH